MHLMIIMAALATAFGIRFLSGYSQGCWIQRWRQTLFSFLFPPLLIFMTAIALVCMGPFGRMGIWHTSWFSYVVAIGCLIYFVGLWINLVRSGWKSVKSARECERINLADTSVRLLPVAALFAGQIGFWRPELVISQGLIDTLSEPHLEAVLAHEKGHYHFRDTFWFFWLGWVRECTAWLPNTEVLYSELLVLRELRADTHAASQVDPLLLAESLLVVVSSPPLSSEICCAALNESGTGDRLSQRIDALLSQPEPIQTLNLGFWKTFTFAFLPLIAVIFHT